VEKKEKKKEKENSCMYLSGELMGGGWGLLAPISFDLWLNSNWGDYSSVKPWPKDRVTFTVNTKH
jgi:hypothetical protein